MENPDVEIQLEFQEHDEASNFQEAGFVADPDPADIEVPKLDPNAPPATDIQDDEPEEKEPGITPEDFVWNYVCSLLNSKLGEMSNLFNELDSSGDGKLDRGEVAQILGKMHIHLNENELDVVMSRSGADERGNVGFVNIGTCIHWLAVVRHPKGHDTRNHHIFIDEGCFQQRPLRRLGVAAQTARHRTKQGPCVHDQLACRITYPAAWFGEYRGCSVHNVDQQAHGISRCVCSPSPD